MIRNLVRALSLVMGAALGATAHADAIQFSASGAGLPAFGAITEGPIDLAQGATATLTSPPLTGDSFTALAWTNNSLTISGALQVEITTFSPPGVSGSTSYSAEFTVPIQGVIHGEASTSDLQGGFSGTGASAMSFYTPEVVLPQDLVDLISHPERIHVSAVTSGGPANLLSATVTIDPFPTPAPVPEPTVLSILVVGLGGTAVHRWRKHVKRL